MAHKGAGATGLQPTSLPEPKAMGWALACYFLPASQAPPPGNLPGPYISGCMCTINQAEPCTNTHPHVQAQCLTLPQEPPPTLAGYLDPGPQSWFHGQEGQWLSPRLGATSQGNFGVNGKRPLPPWPLGQEAQSHGGGRGPLPPGRPQGCGGAWGTQGPAREAAKDPV